MISAATSGKVHEAFERCQRRFPTIRLQVEEFVDRAAKSGVPFEQLHHEDLFLALACARGDRIAWECFADDYLLLLQRLAAQACRRFQESEDLAQDILARLIEDRGKLYGYDGRGSLASWLRVAVARAAIDRFRRVQRDVSLEETTERGHEITAQNGSPQGNREPLDAHWGPILARVLAAEIDRLPPRDRLLLNLYYWNEVPLKSIGRRFGVHEATVSRWLDRIRSNIRKNVEGELRRRHGLRPRDTGSLWRWVAEEGAFSLNEIFK